jgi:hypothetical protein
MVPRVELPPATPPTAQVTAVLKLPVPATVAVHWEVALVWTDVGTQAAATDVMVGAAVTVIDAEPDLAALAVLVAVIVTGLVVGTALGAV